MAGLQLYLLRHAKSAWDEPVPDHERALADRGRKAAPRVGAFLSRIDEVPDLVLTSTARRATQTAAVAAEAGGWTSEIVLRPELYGATPTEIVEVVRRHGAEATRLLVVGHEPGLSQCLGSLCGRARVRVPTAAIARLDVDVERWDDLAPGAGELRWLVPPRLLGALRR